MAKQHMLHFCPEDGWAGDPMPLWFDGAYHIYYTKLRRDGVTTWGHIATRDFVSVEEYPDPLVPGGPSDPDAKAIKTGCVVERDGAFHLFYAACDMGGGDHMLRAVSRDGIHFEKCRGDLFSLDPRWYRADGTWRDPCVVWDGQSGLYRMLFCARKPALGPEPFPGRLGMAVSPDLVSWTLAEPRQADGISGVMECPDAFPMGDGWALLYYWHDTRIRFARDFSSPWARRRVLSPNHFDFMAAKRCWDGARNVLVGWIPRKDCDCGRRIWGGCLAWPRELYLDGDGEPACRFLPETDRVMPAPVPAGDLSMAVRARGTLRAAPEGAFVLTEGCAVLADVPADYRLRFSVAADAPGTVFALLIRAGADNERNWAGDMSRGYQVIFDFPSGLLRLREHYEWDQRSDLAAIPLRGDGAGGTDVDLLLHADILEINVNRRETMVYRLTRFMSGALAILASDGSATLRRWRMHC